MRSILRAGQAGVRLVAGNNSAVERFFRGRYKRLVERAQKQADSSVERTVRSLYATSRFRVTGDFTSRNWTVFRRGKSDKRLGIYMIGSCDLPALFTAKPLIASGLDGICAILRDGDVAEARSDLLLQTLEPIESSVLREIIARLEIAPTVLEPRLFKSSFQIPDIQSLGDMPKTVIALSIGADLTRTVYRHNESGFLVDPGGYWLKQDLKVATQHSKKLQWFRSHFTSVGMFDAEGFRQAFGRVLSLASSPDTTIVVFNTAVVNPGDPTYSYQYRRNPSAIRRMEFNDVLADLAAVHGISVLNVDRVLKQEGINEQVDFAHFPLERMMPVAAEFHRILRDREVI